MPTLSDYSVINMLPWALLAIAAAGGAILCCPVTVEVQTDRLRLRYMFWRRDIRWRPNGRSPQPAPATVKTARSFWTRSAAFKSALPGLARRVRVSRCLFHARFSLGDAAQTAVAHGVISAFISALYPALAACKPTIGLWPEFTERPYFSLQMDVSLQTPLWAACRAYWRLRNYL